jgi:hypothetical protein
VASRICSRIGCSVIGEKIETVKNQGFLILR